MAELFTKTNDGELRKIGDVDSGQISRIKNDANIDDIKAELDSFWTPEKLGKHKQLKEKHGTILLKDLLVSAKVFFEQVKSNKFKFQNFGPFSFGSFLKKAHLDKYVKMEYVDDCLKVTTPRPAIGKGEFLLASCFSNINFRDDSGDLIDSDGNRIEVKGKHATLAGEGPYKQMNKGVLFALYRLFETNTDAKDLNLDVIEDLENKLIDNKQLLPKAMDILQNLETPSRSLTNSMCELFNSKQDLKLVIAATHLYTYLKIQKANYLFALNDNVFWGFAAPKNLEEAYEIISHFNVTGWVAGNKGISITVKNG